MVEIYNETNSFICVITVLLNKSLYISEELPELQICVDIIVSKLFIEDDNVCIISLILLIDDSIEFNLLEISGMSVRLLSI